MARLPKPVAVDLFAGAGGLSLGARRAGFKVPVAVEIDPEITTTYQKNHPDVTLIQSDIRELCGADLKRKAGGHIDLLMGCAPCQGFCSLTLKNEREDPRNQLVLEMARLVEETKPTAVLMENVPGLALRGKSLLAAFIKQLRDAGYKPQWWNVEMADFGVPQRRRRLVLLAGKGFEIALPTATHARRPKRGDGRRPWRTVASAIRRERTPDKVGKQRGPRAANWHVVRNLLPDTLARLRATEPGDMRHQLSKNLLPDCHQQGYEGFRNVYMRMAWNAPAPTITAGCTTPAKGRFGHPDRRRTTISVREAATLQTFPKGFRFDSAKIDRVCQMIGNAVPPLFAEQLAVTAYEALRNRARRNSKSE